MLVTLTPGVDRQRINDLLHNASRTIDNNAGNLDSYCRWVQDLARMLRGQIARTDLDQRSRSNRGRLPSSWERGRDGSFLARFRIKDYGAPCAEPSHEAPTCRFLNERLPPSIFPLRGGRLRDAR